MMQRLRHTYGVEHSPNPRAVSYTHLDVYKRQHLALAEAPHPQGTAADKYVDRAEQHVRRALELEPDNALAHNELARIAIARGRFYRAAGYLANGVAVDPGQHVLHVNMNVVFGLAVRQAHFSILGACLVICLLYTSRCV